MAERKGLSVDSATLLPREPILAAWSDAINAGSPVESVAGKTGAVTVSTDDLSDVTITAPAAGQVIKYNGTVWTNQADIGGGGGGDVASVNGQTGSVVLDADDVPDTSTTNKWMSAAEKAKLAGVATGATANASDATLLNRGNHTGSQTAATISDFNAAADARVAAGITGAVGASVQAHDTDLDAIAALSPSNDDVLQRKAGAWVSRTPAQVKTDLGLSRTDVGLGSVDNTADMAKPVSTAVGTALAAKANANVAVNAGTGLSGGGDLSASRTLAVAYGTTAGTAAQGNDSRITGAAADSTVVHLAGNETIAGTKTFSAGPAVPTAAPGTSTTQAASTAFVAAGLAGKAATDDLAIINAAVTALDTDKADVDERYWDGDSWTARPSVTAGVPVKAYSVLDASATPPPDALAGDIWFRATA